MRAKVVVEAVTENKAGDGLTYSERLQMRAVYGDGNPENNTFAQATPCLQVDMTVDNKELFGKVKKDDEFYLDFILVEKEAPAPAEGESSSSGEEQSQQQEQTGSSSASGGSSSASA